MTLPLPPDAFACLSHGQFEPYPYLWMHLHACHGGALVVRGLGSVLFPNSRGIKAAANPGTSRSTMTGKARVGSKALLRDGGASRAAAGQ